MKTESEIKAATTAQLREWTRNAYTTFMQCSGHEKALRNDLAVSRYEAELRRRGAAYSALLIGGSFNGPGAY